MPTNEADNSTVAVLDRRRLEAIGVLLPIRPGTLSLQSGVHSLGRAGEGMRFLRSRPYDPGFDNPRDIDRFSPADEYWVNEWEFEAQASQLIYCDMAESMSFPPLAAVRNLAVLQFTYSLWRAGDRIRSIGYSSGSFEHISKPNLRSQLESLATALAKKASGSRLSVLDLLSDLGGGRSEPAHALKFIVSDFQTVPDFPTEGTRRRWREALRQVRADIVPVIVTFELDREQFGLARLCDPESGHTRQTLLTPARIDRINAAERARTDKLKAVFRRLGVDSLILRSERDVFPALLELARLRRRRQA